MKNHQQPSRFIAEIAFGTIIAATLFIPVGKAQASNNAIQTNNTITIGSPSNLEASEIKSRQIKSPKLIARRTVNLSGRWRASDGGTYYLKQIGNELWWFGESPNQGATWSNIFHGQIQGKQIAGKWVDVPKGRNNLAGEITLKVLSPNRLRAVRKTGGFGGSVWIRIR
ncbi:hypothetical protein [Rivularia sp. PCC 7116]|uniref:hypothetical protein n=1 Tax=Rivularia sp. PCC 7116 TaxID=373994 RepID=UPI000309D317|nr:hypothetical protein [Rivularia sp. PCC 7116]